MQRLLITILLMTIMIQPIPVQASVGKTFLNDEAGITAYFSFVGPTNLQSNLLRNLFRTISTSPTNENYLIGYIPAVGYENTLDQDIKVFIHNAGWVVVFYPKDRSITNALDVEGELETRLEKILDKIAFAIEVTDYQIAFTHMQYPSATHWLRIGRIMHDYAIANFQIRLPSTNTYYERSYYLTAIGWLSDASLFLDGLQIVKIGTGYAYNFIHSEKMVTNAKHIIGIEKGYYGTAWTDISIVYSGTAEFPIDYTDYIYNIDLQPLPTDLAEAASVVPHFFDTFLPMIRN